MTKKENIYLKRYAYSTVQLTESPYESLKIIVVIPAYDEPNLISTLNSLRSCSLPASPNYSVEVIVVINHEKNAPSEVVDRNKKTKESMREWLKVRNTERLRFHMIYKPNLPKKYAGVGLARKIGMDEAVRRFASIKNNKGVIACLDADCLVERNYFEALFEHWKMYPECNGVSLYFEHPIRNINAAEKNGIVDYELHLRYYVNAQKYAGFPFAFQTVGSCMAVTTEAYQKQGGMNKRKAGEDFWFLQKIFQLGDYHNLNTTRVIPSPRPSYRVPFGTGKFINAYLSRTDKKPTITYHFNTFKDLKHLLHHVDAFHTKSSTEISLPEGTKAFFATYDFEKILKKIRQNSASLQTFRKGFFHWFDGFKLMKYVHFHRDHYYPDDVLDKQVDQLLKVYYGEDRVFKNNEERLLFLRERDRTERR